MTATTETVYRHQIEQAAMPGAEILGDVLRPRSRKIHRRPPRNNA
jgi:hypothetical protein